jgi:hypothetical protein
LGARLRQAQSNPLRPYAFLKTLCRGELRSPLVLIMTTLLTIDAKKNADSSLVFSNISWPQFDAIAMAFNEIAGVRLTYLDNVLEIMSRT